MPARHLPVRPNLEQLKHQAKDLLRQIRRGDPSAIEELHEHHPGRVEPRSAKLADTQLALARSYTVASWPRLVLACRVIDAIWRDDVTALRRLMVKHPQLLHEMASGRVQSNWGPPMSYAANLGRDRIIAMLRDLGAADLQSAMDRAVLQGQIETARKLYAMGARPPLNAMMGPAETQNGAGLAFLLELGVAIGDGDGNRLAPVAMLLETYSRNPQGKHQCLELFASHGIELPDTSAMAVHRGRIDLLEEHLRRDPGLLARTFSHQEIYPPELGCHADESLAMHGTPLTGATLLHLCVDFAEMELAQWLIERGMDVNARAEVDADGFGGHTALFGCVVSMAHAPQKHRPLEDAPFARLLLDHGADPNARASLRKRVRWSDDETMHEYRDVTPLSWGERFHERGFVSRPAMHLVAERGGHG
jgi:Ankyrin repeat